MSPRPCSPASWRSPTRRPATGSPLINPALYRLASEHPPGLVSIRSGNTTVSFRQGGRKYTVRGYGARAGYNLATGLGTVNAQLFVPELARAAR